MDAEIDISDVNHRLGVDRRYPDQIMRRTANNLTNRLVQELQS